MKGVIYYYSATGNTKLACEYIALNIKNIPFELINIAKNSNIKISTYDVVGFAIPTEFWGPPYLVKTFIDTLPEQHNKPAFVFNTYGLLSGKTLEVLKDWVKAKGFKVIAGYSLQTPENFPPLIVKGITSKNAPKQKDLCKFNNFIAEIDRLLLSSSFGELEFANLKIGLINSLLPIRPRDTAKHDMGEKFVDSTLCTECGICKKECPYEAIQLNPKPIFNMNKCYGCWSCFNHCPNKAIYTRTIRGKGHYPKPLESLNQKLE